MGVAAQSAGTRAVSTTYDNRCYVKLLWSSIINNNDEYFNYL